jgi:murein DD-endopeptidase MepM/ murein hydrolase activator NlpD
MIRGRRQVFVVLLAALVTACGPAVASIDQPAAGGPASGRAQSPLRNDPPATDLSDPATPAEPLPTVSLELDSTPVASLVTEWNAPPYPAPWAILTSDHFFFNRPLPSGEDTWLHPRFRYGNTHFGEEPTHAGVDIVAPRGTPVLAAADGEVVWVGYGLYRGLRDETDPYGLAVAIEHDFGYQGQRLFTAYTHLNRAEVWDGQRVSAGDVIGFVGSTGHASGPHLHFEVRLGENRYFATRNPELWLVPLEGHGVLAAQLYDSWGRPLIEYPLELRNLDSGETFIGYSYNTETVNSDDFYQENLAVTDLPAGPYELQIDYVGHEFYAHLYLLPGQTTRVSFHGRDGFTLDE